MGIFKHKGKKYKTARGLFGEEYTTANGEAPTSIAPIRGVITKGDRNILIMGNPVSR